MISNSPNECLCCGSTATIPLVSLLGTMRGGSTARILDPDRTPLGIPKMMRRRAA